jgi:hypothetical protein
MHMKYKYPHTPMEIEMANILDCDCTSSRIAILLSSMIRNLFAAIAAGFIAGCVAHPDNIHPESLHRRDAAAQAIVSKAITALGGKDAMLAIKAVSSHS